MWLIPNWRMYILALLPLPARLRFRQPAPPWRKDWPGQRGIRPAGDSLSLASRRQPFVCCVTALDLRHVLLRRPQCLSRLEQTPVDQRPI